MTSPIDIEGLSWVSESKFVPNRPRLDLVRRPRLLDRLEEVFEKKLALIVAPAGYGKSSLLGQWLIESQSKRVQFGWLTLEDDEQDGKRFLALVTLALARAGAPLDELVTGAQNGFADSAPTTILSKLIRCLNSMNKKVVLILEDYHHAESAEINGIIQQLLRDILSDFTLVIDSRKQPEINAYSLIASGEAIEVDATQLRMTQDETIAALEGVVDIESGNDIFVLTEGWPVAVQLARVQKSARPDEPIISDVKSGLIAAYLTEQVLSSLDERTQEFLLTVAHLDRFDSEMVGFVLQIPDAWRGIETLSSFAALIVPLDSTGGWFRLHHLFAEYLKELQKRRDASKTLQILLRASQWHADQGDIVGGVRYAVAAHDLQRCEEIIRNAGGWRIILTKSIGELRSALRLLPVDFIGDSAALLIARAYLHCKDGEVNQARALITTAADTIRSDDETSLQVGRIVVESMINLYEDGRNQTKEFDILRDRLVADHKLDALELGTVKCDEFLTSLREARLEDADMMLREAFSQMRQSGSVLGLNYCYIHAAHIALHRGDFELAGANVERALTMAEENFGFDSGLKNLALVLSFSLKVWQGQAVVEDYDAFLAAVEHTIDYDGWTEIYITGLESLLMLCAQLRVEDKAADVWQRFDFFSKDANLPRLQKFCSMFAVPKIEQNKVEPVDLEGALYGGFSFRDWQAFVLHGVREIKKNEVSCYEKALAFVHDEGAGLHEFKLLFAHAIANPPSDDRALDENLLTSIKVACPNRMAGPFLAEPKLFQRLQQLRWQLRHDEQELVALRFIDTVLDISAQLNPVPLDDIFSEREREVLIELAYGRSNKEIARALELTENTVKFHLKSVFTKLSVSKRTQAVVEAQRLGLLD